MALRRFQKALQRGQTCMSRETEMVDFSRFFLPDQILQHTVLRIQECLNSFIGDTVAQIEIEVVYPAFFQLLFKKGFLIFQVFFSKGGNLLAM